MVPMIVLTNEVLSFMFRLSTFFWQSSRLVIESVIYKINTFFFQLCVQSFWGNIPLFSTKMSCSVPVFHFIWINSDLFWCITQIVDLFSSRGSFWKHFHVLVCVFDSTYLCCCLWVLLFQSSCPGKFYKFKKRSRKKSVIKYTTHKLNKLQKIYTKRIPKNWVNRNMFLTKRISQDDGNINKY